MNPLEIAAVVADPILAVERLVGAEMIGQCAQAPRKVLWIDSVVIGLASGRQMRFFDREQGRCLAAPDNAIGNQIPFVDNIAGRFDSRTPAFEIR